MLSVFPSADRVGRQEGVGRDEGAALADDPTVLVTSRPPRHRVDYVDQLIGDDSAGEAPGGVQWEFRSDPSRTDGVDVVHLTDISTVIGGRRTSERERVRRAKRFVKLLRRRRIALVRTLHGEETLRPASRAEALLDRAAATVISLTTPTQSSGRSAVVIRHSHLRDRFLGFPTKESVRGRALITANGVLPTSYEAAVKVFGLAEASGWTLRIAGTVPLELADSYARTLADHPGTMSLREEALSDALHVTEISQAEIVIVTRAETYHGQSTVMLALSLDRPVLVEDTEQTRSLAEEVGSSWVRLYEGSLTAVTLEAALAALRADPPTVRPNLDARDPNSISAQYAAVLRAAAAGR